MKSGSYIDSLNELNQSLYKGLNDYKDFKAVDSYSDNTGLYIGIFQNKSDTIFAVRGTDVLSGIEEFLKDSEADKTLFERNIPKQLDSAEKYFNSNKDKYANIIFTGYSLGGSIAQILGNRYGNETYTFEAFATGSFESQKHSGNIHNFGNLNDPIFKADLKNHIGNVYAIPSKINLSGFCHIYPLYGKPSTAKKIDKNIDIDSVYKDVKKVEPYVKQGYHYAKDELKPTVEKGLDKAKTLTKQTLQKVKSTTQK